MYIRRKVFSILEVDGEERLFSTNEFSLEERLYFQGIEGGADAVRAHAKKTGMSLKESLTDLQKLAEEKAARREAKRNLARQTNKEVADGIKATSSKKSAQDKIAKEVFNKKKDKVNQNLRNEMQMRGQKAAEKRAGSAAQRQAEKELVEKAAKNKAMLTRGGKIAAGVAAGGALIYGGKKVYDHYKGKKANNDAAQAE